MPQDQTNEQNLKLLSSLLSSWENETVGNKVKNLLAKLSRNGEIRYEPKGDRRGWRLG